MTRMTNAVYVVIVTDGGASHPNHPSLGSIELASRRKAEAYAATGALGISPDRVAFLGARDGSLAALGPAQTLALTTQLAEILGRIAPYALFLPCRRDGSSEHDATFSLIEGALEQAGLKPRVLEFPVWSWWNPMLLLRSMFAYGRIWRVNIAEARGAKANALNAYTTQTLPIPPETTSALPPGFVSMFPVNEEFLLER
jgi:LmbE family N-acetylglucosaminyl deacetylase